MIIKTTTYLAIRSAVIVKSLAILDDGMLVVAGLSLVGGSKGGPYRPNLG